MSVQVFNSGLWLSSAVWSQLDFWLHPVSTELPVDIRVPRSSLSSVTEYLRAHNIPYSVIINDLQVCYHVLTQTLIPEYQKSQTDAGDSFLFPL